MLHRTIRNILSSMIDRRRFLKGIAAAAVTPSITSACRAGPEASRLVPDANRILDLPQGFDYTIVSRAGDPMNDGLLVPTRHDGMAAFPADDGTIRLVCNHELQPDWPEVRPLHERWPDLPESMKSRFYDRGGDVTPGAGGTTTTIYNPETKATERQFLSLGGTEYNCAGGATPWGTWLSCEECFESEGNIRYLDRAARRDRKHGYVFEVSAYSNELVDAVPIKAMGRFEHEACAIHEPTGIVYMTEDRRYGLFYRYIPDVPGKLIEGGLLQALVIRDRPSGQTHNWSSTPDVTLNKAYETAWVDVGNPDPEDNGLRLTGAKLGAATFARGEGLCEAGDRFAFACTNGGRAQQGQVFTYKPSVFEGTAAEQDEPGELMLIAESDGDSLLQNADNLVMAPWGDLIVCEDTAGHCGLVGIRPDGSQYALADNVYSDSELAGACFSPDGSILFVNIQHPGTTLAIAGPWPTPG
jgi:secreted PhoX family phosphatase